MTRETVVLWPDTFTDHLSPEVGRAAVRVLESAGRTPVLPARGVCCGLTYVSTSGSTQPVPSCAAPWT